MKLFYNNDSSNGRARNQKDSSFLLVNLFVGRFRERDEINRSLIDWKKLWSYICGWYISFFFSWWKNRWRHIYIYRYSSFFFWSHSRYDFKRFNSDGNRCFVIEHLFIGIFWKIIRSFVLFLIEPVNFHIQIFQKLFSLRVWIILSFRIRIL